MPFMQEFSFTVSLNNLTEKDKTFFIKHYKEKKSILIKELEKADLVLKSLQVEEEQQPKQRRKRGPGKGFRVKKERKVKSNEETDDIDQEVEDEVASPSLSEQEEREQEEVQPNFEPVKKFSKGDRVYMYYRSGSKPKVEAFIERVNHQYASVNGETFKIHTGNAFDENSKFSFISKADDDDDE